MSPHRRQNPMVVSVEAQSYGASRKADQVQVVTSGV